MDFSVQVRCLSFRTLTSCRRRNERGHCPLWVVQAVLVALTHFVSACHPYRTPLPPDVIVAQGKVLLVEGIPYKVGIATIVLARVGCFKDETTCNECPAPAFFDVVAADAGQPNEIVACPGKTISVSGQG